jgi:deoxyribonuclease V
MEYRELHSWDVSIEEAQSIQDRLRDRISLEYELAQINIVAGVDVSVDNVHERMYGTVVCMRFPELDIIEIAKVATTPVFPYIPGLLSFREGPCVISCFKQLEYEPDVVIFDGQGIAHPKRLGLATHIGLWIDKPTVGCAKHKLIGRYIEPGNNKGSWQELVDNKNNDVIGAVLRTKQDVKPVFVSPGFKITLQDAISVVLACCTKYRLPEPVRQAHILSKKMRDNPPLLGDGC